VIVVDSSAIVAILQNESSADALLLRLGHEPHGERVMSTASYIESGSVLAGRSKGNPKAAVADLDAFLAKAGIELVAVDIEQAHVALSARIAFGRGFGAPAALNYGDCFSYALAKVKGAPLLFVGDDFDKTDITPALKLRN
jgi:ribonuclease VapC